MRDDVQTTWTNWVGNQSCAPAAILTAETDEEVAAAINQARAAKRSIRTAGGGHSFSPVVNTDGVLLDTAALSGILSIDPEAQTITAKAQTVISDIGAPLLDAGLALKNQGDINTQTLIGAVSTATHGSGLEFGSFSGELTACRLVDGTGTVRALSRAADPDVFPAVQCAIGTLGIVTEVTLSCAKAYRLKEDIEIMHVDALRERWDDYLATYRHFSFFWMPTDGSSVLYGFPEAPADSCYVKLYSETDAPAGSGGSDVGKRIDEAYKIYPHVFEPNFHELEYFIPADEGIEAFEAHRALMLSLLPDSVFPMEVRFVRSEEAWMSPNYQRDNMVISVSGAPGTDYWPYLRACDEHLYGLNGRPHWGKLHFMTAERLAERFPRFDDFRAVREQFDPDGVFLNDHLRGLFA
ncbi:MAG: D-arabinono-1,4-lactone oxidase [Pseudomonadota bacterium]